MAYHAPLKLSSKDIPADVILQIAEEIVNISEDPARDIHSFFSTTPALRNQGLAQDLIWKRAHYAQFGPLPRELGLLPESDGFTWRSLVVSRLAIINSERCRLGRGLVQRFRMSPDIRYTMAQLQTELGYPLLARNVMVEAITLVKPVLRSYTCMPFGSPSVHAAFLYTRAPPYHENLYASLALRGVVVPPFASPILPQTAFGITQVPALDLDARVGRYEYRDRVDFAQQNILRPLKRLILATAHVTSQTIHDITFLDAFLPLARLDHDPSAIWARILGEGKLVESVGARGHVVTMVFSPAHADPQRNPLYWVRRLPMVDELSTIGYAFCGDTLPPRWDSTTFGRGHADHIITITVRGLRLYDTWLKQWNMPERVSPGITVLKTGAGMDDLDARSLHEVLMRLSSDAPFGRAPGWAIPPFC